MNLATKWFGRALAISTSLLVLLLLCTSIAMGQETYGKLTGKVLDPSGAAVPGASVEISGGSLVRAVTATSNAAGEYLFDRVPVGTGYKVTATAKGFRTATKPALSILVGVTAQLELKLEVGQMTETVVVAADAAMVDTSSSSSQTAVDASFFDILPKGRSFYDLAGIAPGARLEGKSGGYEVDGASGSENTYFLDGMNVTGIQQGTLSGQSKVPVEMIQQVQIKNGVMDAEYGGAMGGVVSAVVRSGTNSWHGEGGFYFNNNSLQARPRPSLALDPNDPNEMTAIYNQSTTDNFTKWNPVVNIAGPIWKNKLFGFVGYAPQLNNYDRTVNFVTGQTGKYTQSYYQQFGTAKVDYVPVDKIHVAMSWIWSPYKTTGRLPSAAGTDSYTNNWASQGDYSGGQTLSGSIDYMATSKLIFSFRGGYNYTGYNTNYGVPTTTAVYYSNSNIGMTGIPADLQRAGGWVNQAVGLTKYDLYARKTYSADVSYMFNLAGQHTIKGGWQMNDMSNDIFSSTYPFGYYRYYWNTSYHCQTSGCTGDGKGAYGYYRYRLLGTIGDSGSTNHGLFIQDNWRVNKHLTFNLGLRTEREFVPSYSSDPKIPHEAIVFDWAKKMSPRIGAAFDPKGNGKMVIRAGFGIFYDIMKYELPRGSFGGDVWRDYYYTLDDPTLVTKLQGVAADPKALPGRYMDMVDSRIPSNDPSKGLIDPNLKPMATRMFDVGFDYSLNPTLVASVRFTDRRLIRTIEDIGYATPDGETYIIGNPGFGTVASAANWQKWMGSGIPTTPKAKRNYDAVEFRLDKRFSTKYQFTASYTWSRLYGNYSGLASSDESDSSGNGRTSPAVNRYFDQPWVGVKQDGTYAEGLLATDRPSTFKFMGGYTHKWKLGATTLSPIVNLYSGTPLTTEAGMFTNSPLFPYGRGNLGRTPFFQNYDLSLVHEVNPFRSHEAWKVRLEFTVFNLLNDSTVIDKYKNLVHETDGHFGLYQGGANIYDSSGDPCYACVFKGFDARTAMAAEGVRTDPRYGMPYVFHGPRSARFQVSFRF